MGEDGNRGSVHTELQADCLTGVWASNTEREKHVLEKGDIDEALAAAAGDDKLQGASQGYGVSDSFTHGTLAQRAASFSQDFDGRTVGSCGITGVAH